jgi:hypothetical protein
MFSPGSQPFVPVNLLSKKSISFFFFAKGDGQTHRVLVFTASAGRTPRSTGSPRGRLEKAERPILRFQRDPTGTISRPFFLSEARLREI